MNVIINNIRVGMSAITQAICIVVIDLSHPLVLLHTSFRTLAVSTL